MRYLTSKEHPEQRLLNHGATVLSDAELLSVLLSSARRGSRHCSVADANRLINDIDNLSGLLREKLSLYERHFGPTVSERRYAVIQASIELSKRMIARKMPERDVMGSPDEVRRYLSLHMTGLEHEVFAVMFLDNRHGVICYEEMFRGTIDSAAVYPREVVKAALNRNSAALVFCHNHPSGRAEPSDTDVRLTRKLIDALSTVDIRVLDHIICGDGETVSLAERGLM